MEVLSSVVIPLNFILYMPSKILAYLSNILKANFDRMDSMVACGTLKNLTYSVWCGGPGHLKKETRIVLICDVLPLEILLWAKLRDIQSPE